MVARARRHPSNRGSSVLELVLGPDAKSEGGKSLVQAEEVEERAQSVSSTEPEPQWLN